jgi:hypothetical protein
MDGAWRLRVTPWTGSLESDVVLTGPPLLELENQTAEPDSLPLLQALLAGGQA